MSLAQHHQRVRRRLYKNLEPYPHPSPAVRFLDRIIFVVGFLGPAFTIPQIWQIYGTGHAAGVSALTWSGYAAFNIVWIIYGLVHRERAITFTYSLWLIANTTVALGAIIFR